MAVATIATRPRTFGVTQGRRILVRVGLLAFLAGLAYLVVVPLWQLQTLALEDRARGYRNAFTDHRWRRQCARRSSSRSVHS